MQTADNQQYAVYDDEDGVIANLEESHVVASSSTLLSAGVSHWDNQQQSNEDRFETQGTSEIMESYDDNEEEEDEYNEGAASLNDLYAKYNLGEIGGGDDQYDPSDVSQYESQLNPLSHQYSSTGIPAGDDSMVSGSSTDPGSPQMAEISINHNTGMQMPKLPGNGGSKVTYARGSAGGGGAGGSSTSLLAGGLDPSTPGRIVETGQEHTGRWTREEHNAFLSGLKLYGKEWKKVAAKVKTRTVVQTRTHAQKYFQKLQKSKGGGSGGGSGTARGTDFDDMDDEFFVSDIDMGTLSSDTKKPTPPPKQQQQHAMDPSAIAAATVVSLRQPKQPPTTTITTTITAPLSQSIQSYSGSHSTTMIPSPTSASMSTAEQQQLDVPAKLPKIGRRTSTATLSAAQVITSFSSMRPPAPLVNDGTTGSVSGLVHGFSTTPSHGWSASTSTATTAIPGSSTTSSIPSESGFGVVASSHSASSKFLMRPLIGGGGVGRGIMKITAPDPTYALSEGAFPEPSPAATGKRKLDEIAAARMLAGVMSGGVQHIRPTAPQSQPPMLSHQQHVQQHHESDQYHEDMRPPARQTQSQQLYAQLESTNNDDDGPPTPPVAGTTTSSTFSMANAPALPFMGVPTSSAAGKAIITSNNHNPKGKIGGGGGCGGMTLQIVNPDSLGASLEKNRKRGGGDSPVTPWNEQLEALEERLHGRTIRDNNLKRDADDDSDELIPDCSIVSSSNNHDVGTRPKDNGIHSICDTTTVHGRSELHYAVCKMYYDELQTLVTSKSMQLNRADDRGYFPIHSACALRLCNDIATTPANGDGSSNVEDDVPLKLVCLLLGAGANPNETDRNGNVPLHWAARAGDFAIVKQLLAQNTTIDSRNLKGETPLHWAMRTGIRAFDVVTVLMKYGASCTIADSNFRRPADVACDGFLDDDHSVASIRAKEAKEKGTVASSHKRISRELKIALKAVADDKQAMRSHMFQLSTQSKTLVLHHPECLEHITKSESDWEVPDRVQTIMQCILSSESTTKTKELSSHGILPHEITVSADFDRASLDLLSRVHSTEYLSFVNKLSKDLEKRVKESENNQSADNSDSGSVEGGYKPLPSVVPFTPMVQRSMIKIDESNVKLGVNSDTSFSAGSLRAARRAAGAIQHAVNCVLVGRNRNAFCVVRPPGHHAGINGLLDGGESCGFCIFNNVAAGALYAIEEDSLMCDRCAIVDIDVHHGNGTEEIVRKCHDPSKLFFFSIHLYDNDKRKRINPNQVVYKFYPGTGMEDDLALNIINVPIVPLWKDCVTNAPRTHNTRMKARNDTTSSTTTTQDDSSDTSSRNNSINTDNGGGSSTGNSSTLSGRLAYREAIRNRLLPALRAFNPDLILISAGFDALKYDVGNARHEGVGREKMGLDLDPEDYAWTTRKILQIADICCQGRVVSILEGGYGRTPVQKANNNNNNTSNNSNSNHVPDVSNNNNNNNSTNQDVYNLDRTLFGECAVRHLQAMIDPYDTENRFTSRVEE